MSINSNSPTTPAGFDVPQTPRPSTHNDIKTPQQPTTYQAQSPTSLEQAQATQATHIPNELKKIWRLTQITGTGDDDNLNESLDKHAVIIDLTHAPKGSAFAGCNYMNFTMRLDGDRFGFGNISSTRKLCFDVMWLEVTLAKSVRATRQYKLEGDSLVLYGNTIRMHLVPHS